MIFELDFGVTDLVLLLSPLTSIYLFFGRQPVIGQKDETLHKQIVFYTEAAELKLSHGWMDTHNKSSLCDVR